MLADLGLGKALDVSSRLTMIAGTPSFVAPEQAQGEPLDAAGRPLRARRADPPAADRRAGVPARVALRRGRARPAAGAVATAGGSSRRGGRGRRPAGPRTRTASSAGPTSRRTSRRSPRVARPSHRRRPARCRSRGCRSTRTSPSPVRGRPRCPPTTRCPTRPRPGRAPGRRVLVGVAAVVALGGRGRGGYARPRAAGDRLVEVSDATGSLSVTVPAVLDGRDRGPGSGPRRTRTAAARPCPPAPARAGDRDRRRRGHLRRRAPGRRPARAAARPRRVRERPRPGQRLDRRRPGAHPGRRPAAPA